MRLGLLDDPHDRVRLIHVTGTKGRVPLALARVDSEMRLSRRAGASPHLEHVEERIQVDGAISRRTRGGNG